MPFSDPPLMNDQDIVEVSIRGELCGQVVLTILHYRADLIASLAVDSAMDDLYSALADVGHVKDKYLAAACSNYSMKEIVCQVIHSVRLARFPHNSPGDGLMAAEARTADLCAVMLKRCALAADRGLAGTGSKVGRVHFPAIPDDQMDGGYLMNDYMNNKLSPLIQKICEVIDGADGAQYVPVLFGKLNGGVILTEVPYTDVRPEVRVMRRRTVGRGI